MISGTAVRKQTDAIMDYRQKRRREKMDALKEKSKGAPTEAPTEAPKEAPKEVEK